MLQIWRRQLRKRPWIAVAVAYALALQLALAGVLASGAANAGAGDGAPIICSAHGGTGGPDGQAPAGEHAQCALCCLATVGGAILPTVPVGPVRKARPFVASAPFAFALVAVTHGRDRHQTGPPRFSV